MYDLIKEQNRHSLRLPTYNYAADGMYFITICTQDRECLFGSISDAQLRLNEAGIMISKIWQHLPERFPFIGIDTFIIMPDHMHGIIRIHDARNPETQNTIRNQNNHQINGTQLGTISRAIQAFKSLSTNEYARHVESDDWPAFSRRLWQRNYWERIIRTNQELDAIRIYIQKNPENWQSP